MTDTQRERLMDEYEAALGERQQRREDLACAEEDLRGARTAAGQEEAELEVQHCRSALADSHRKVDRLRRQFPECRDEPTPQDV